MLHPNFVYVGTLIGSLGALVYLIETIQGKIKPNRVSFFLWSVFPFIVLAVMLQEGAGIEALMTFATGFIPLCILIASFFNKQAEWKITKFDLVCGTLSLIGLVLWLVTKVGNIAILFSILADGLAALPTVIKAYRYPETEIAWPWIVASIGMVVTLLTLQEYTFANTGFLLHVSIVNTIIFLLVQFKLGKKLSR